MNPSRCFSLIQQNCYDLNVHFILWCNARKAGKAGKRNKKAILRRIASLRELLGILEEFIQEEA